MTIHFILAILYYSSSSSHYYHYYSYCYDLAAVVMVRGLIQVRLAECGRRVRKDFEETCIRFRV